jgi:hypothetical protein
MSDKSQVKFRTLTLGLVATMIGACGGNPSLSLELLYDEARATGNWSKVERMEAKQAEARARANCRRAEGIYLCEDRECQCKRATDVARAMRPLIPDTGRRN